MFRKGILQIYLVLAAFIIIILAVYFINSPSSNFSPESGNSPYVVDKDYLQIKYKLYGGSNNIYNRQVTPMSSVFIYNSESLPKEIILGGEKMIIERIELLKIDRGFSIYTYAQYNNEEKKIGFWYLEGGNPNPAYGGILTLTIEKWTEEAPETYKNTGELGTLFEKGVALVSIDYDLATNQWNFIEINELLYKEKLLPLQPI